MITQILLWLVGAAFVVIFVAKAWSMGRLRATSRSQVVRAGADAVVALTLIRAVVPPPGWTSWLWVLAAVAVGVGVAGTILRWRSRSPADRPGRWWPTAIYLAVAAALVVVLA